MKKALTGDGGQQYFEVYMKDALVPGGYEGVQTLRGTLVSARPAARPRELMVAMADAATPEVTLKLDAPMAGTLETGCAIEFEGVPTAFTAAPFMLTFDAERAKIKGLKLKPAGNTKTTAAGGNGGSCALPVKLKLPGSAEAAAKR